MIFARLMIKEHKQCIGLVCSHSYIPCSNNVSYTS